MLMRKTIFCILFSIGVLTTLQARIVVDRVEPPNWWTAMKNPSLQVLLHGQNLGGLIPVVNYPGVTIDSVGRVANANYLFLYLKLAGTVKPGTFQIVLKENGKEMGRVPYELKAREQEAANKGGFDQRDVVYLLMPDRFANGDTTNDSQPSLLEKANRANPDGRHGGDLKGVENHLDFFAGLGMTALWLNPFVENNMPAFSYHGYAITDFYQTDARLGTNQQFASLVEKAHKKGLKIIQDMVFNHCGNNHWFIKDLPAPDWIHQFDTYTRSSFKAPVIMDPHASEADRRLLLDGWFDHMMPDLNQKNPHLAAYLIQNTLWWVEFANLDGIRVDTHMYPDPGFMAQWRTAVRDEYPNLKVVGELWIENKALHSYWMKDAPNPDGYNSELEYLTDFPLFADIRQSLHEQTGWERGAERIYYNLAQDFLYKHPADNLTFLTNHDVSQFYTIAGEDFGKFRLGITLLFTLRGIPQFYQGMEVLMTGDQGEGHGLMRKDFPGGWPGDTANAFTAKGLTTDQHQALNYVKTIANWRKGCQAAQTGKLMQFIPSNDVYVYFRYTDKQKVMVALNFSDQPRTFTTERFREIAGSSTSGTDILTGTVHPLPGTITLQGRTSAIIELK